MPEQDIDPRFEHYVAQQLWSLSEEGLQPYDAVEIARQAALGAARRDRAGRASSGRLVPAPVMWVILSMVLLVGATATAVAAGLIQLPDLIVQPGSDPRPPAVPTEAPAISPGPSPFETPAFSPEPSPLESPAFSPEPSPFETPAFSPGAEPSEPAPATELPGEITPEPTEDLEPQPTDDSEPEPIEDSEPEPDLEPEQPLEPAVPAPESPEAGTDSP
jgi:hypothetical protein